MSWTAWSVPWRGKGKQSRIALALFFTETALLWLILFAAHWLLFFFLGKEIHDPSIGLRVILSFHAQELFLLTIPALLLALLRCAAQSLEGKRIPRLIAYLFYFVAALLFAFCYFADWATLVMAKQFDGLNCVTRFFSGPLQQFRSTSNIGWGVRLALLGLALSLAALLSLAGLAARRLQARGRGALLLALAVCAGFVLVELSPKEVRNSAQESFLKDYQIGPLLTTAADLALLAKERKLRRSFSMNIYPSSRPSVEDYLEKAASSSYRRLNVVVVIVDSLRPDVLRAYGGDVSVMPNLEKLLEKADVFLNNYAQSSESGQSVRCLLASQYPFGVERNELAGADPSVQGLALDVLFKKLDYRTLESAKIDEVIRWISEQKDQSFFATVNLQNVATFELPAGYKRRFSQLTVEKLTLQDFPRDKIDQVKGLYLDGLAYADQQLGMLLGYLLHNRLLEKTMIVVSAKTSQPFYEHDYAVEGGKLYNEAVRVPLVIYDPAAWTKHDHLEVSQHIDVPPSVLYLLGLPAYSGYQGRNLFDSNQTMKQAAYLVVQSPLAHQYAVVQGESKLIFDYQTEKEELYKLSQDPSEKHDLSAEQPDLLKRLKNQLLSWRTAQQQGSSEGY